MVVGNPSKIIKQVSDEMLDWKTDGTRLYQQLPQQCMDTLKPCEPLRIEIDQQTFFSIDYRPFKK